MICPCKNCLVYIRCKHRVIGITTQGKGTLYSFSHLVLECDQLQEFFGVNTITHRVKIKALTKYYHADQSIMHHIKKMPNGKQLVKQFLDVMKYRESSERKLSIKPKKKRTSKI